MKDLSILQLILEATVVVQLVMLLLLAASVYAWAIVFRKRRTLRLANATQARFEREFWSGGDLGVLYRNIESRGDVQGIEAIFQAGFREFARQRQQGVDVADELLEGARRAMKAQLQREMDVVESSLSFLGSVASVSPYVGLFGTVWGIMHAFTGFAGMEQVTLATVAPGIAEALVATAIGLFAAIPAVVAYNRFADQVWRLESRYDAFMEEFSTILQRSVPRIATGAAAEGAR